MNSADRHSGGRRETGKPPGPEVTVSMPAFNTARYVQQAIRSVLGQHEVELELIVVDDASLDGTGEAASRIEDSRLRVIVNRKNQGIARCHNRVLQLSRANFVLHLDSDDVLLERRGIRKLLDRIHTDKDLALLHAHFILMDENGRELPERSREWLDYQRGTRVRGRDYRRALLREGHVSNYPRLYRKDWLLRIGGFNEQLAYGEDYEMALRLAEHHRLDVLPEVLAAVRIRRDSTSRLRFQRLRYWWQRFRLASRLQAVGQISYARDRYRIALRGLPRALMPRRGLFRRSRRNVTRPSSEHPYLADWTREDFLDRGPPG